MFQSMLRDFTNKMILRNMWETTVAAVTTLMVVHARITVSETANSGRPRPTCDHLHWELLAGIISPKEGCFIAHRTTAKAVTSCFKREGCNELEFQDER